MWRDSRTNLIVEGTNEILRLFVAREALDRHLRLAGAVFDARLGIGRRLAAGLGAAAYYAVWYPAQWAAQVFDPAGWLASLGAGRLAPQLRYARRASRRLARAMFHQMLRHGPRLEKRQLQLARFVDIATDLFAMSASIGRASRLAARQEAAGTMETAKLFCLQARRRIEANFRALRSNDDARARILARAIVAGERAWLERDV
jgi:hypothetical protein